MRKIWRYVSSVLTRVCIDLGKKINVHTRERKREEEKIEILHEGFQLRSIFHIYIINTFLEANQIL